MVRRNFGGLRQVTVVNPKGGAGKTVAVLLLAMTFGQKRGGYVLAWDNNETQGTLGMRAQQDFHSRTVRDLLRDLEQFQGAHGRVGDLSQYVRSQGEGMFDVLASDESATGGEMLTAAAFAEIREVVSRFYKLIFVDTGNNVRAQNWQAAMDATDQLVVTMSARNDSAETAARMLDHLEQSGRQRLVRQAVTVVSMPPSRKDIDLPAIQRHFAARTRAVLLAPYERLHRLGRADPVRPAVLRQHRDAWLKIAAAVAEGSVAPKAGPVVGPDLGRVSGRRSASAAAGSQSRRNWAQRAASSASPIASAARDERVQAAQEAPVGLVRPRHRAVALPAAAAQLVQAAVVAGAGVRVRGDGLPGGEGARPRAPAQAALYGGNGPPRPWRTPRRCRPASRRRARRRPRRPRAAGWPVARAAGSASPHSTGGDGDGRRPANGEGRRAGASLDRTVRSLPRTR